MSLEVGIVGLPNSGKTTLFNALTRAGAEITAYASVSDKPNVGMAAIADERLDRVARARRRDERSRLRRSGSSTCLERDRSCSAISARSTRCSQSPTGSRPAPTRQQISRLSSSSCSSPTATTSIGVSSGCARRRSRAIRRRGARSTCSKRCSRISMRGGPLSEWKRELPETLEPLTTMPLLAIENGPGGIDCKLEAELADLPPEEAAAFRDGPFGARRGRPAPPGGSRPDRVLYRERQGDARLDASSGASPRSMPQRRSTPDIARGFIRCEVIRWDDLLAAGSHAEARKRGLERLEGKSYVVRDGDVLNIRGSFGTQRRDG